MGQDYKALSYRDDDTYSDKESDTNLNLQQPANFLVRNKIILLFMAVLTPSIFLNLFLTFRLLKVQTTGKTLVPTFTGMPYDTPVVYRTSTDYWGENDTLADELWNPFPGDPIDVALSPEYVKSHGLPHPSTPFPWDSDKGLYVIKAFHQMHCLKNLRQAFIEIDRNLERTIEPFHIQHCLDALRQDVMCHADDTLMRVMPEDVHRIGDQQVRQCRDWNKLKEWATAPERNSCFRQLSDYKDIYHTLEKYAFCPEDSEYYPVMKEYFDKHGHKDPYAP